MLYVWNPNKDEAERAWMPEVNLVEPEPWHGLLKPLVDFAKETENWEPPTEVLVGRDAVCAARWYDKLRGELKYLIDPTKCPTDPGNAIPCDPLIGLELLRAWQDGPKSKHLVLSRPKDDTKNGVMYLRELLDYLHGYGRDHGTNRVVMFIDRRDPLDMINLSFQRRAVEAVEKNIDAWVEYMNGGAVYRRSDNRANQGWSVHT